MGMVMNADHFLIVIIVAFFAEGFGDSKLVADTHIHQTVARVIIQKLDDSIFQNIEIGHGLIQCIACIKDLPGDHIGKMGNPFGFLEVCRIAEQLDTGLLQFLRIHSHHSFL